MKRNLGIQPREPQPALRFLNGLAGGDEAPASELDGAMKTLLTWIVLPAALPGCRTLAELASAY
ncbi:MAG: hypothetical protein MUF80_06710, partial [Burkholderiales bacterium]|nr:hypothetical protein [Burkholderiales bacterium]